MISHFEFSPCPVCSRRSSGPGFHNCDECLEIVSTTLRSRKPQSRELVSVEAGVRSAKTDAVAHDHHAHWHLPVEPVPHQRICTSRFDPLPGAWFAWHAPCQTPGVGFFRAYRRSNSWQDSD